MVTLKCPHCGEQFDFEAVTHLSPEDSHEEELLKGTLNCVSCPACQKILNVPVRLIYRDTQKPFLLVQEPKALPDEQAKALALQLDESATTAAMNQGVQRPVVRLVFSRPDFLEKLYLWKRGLDDRVIEFAKYQLFNGGTEEGELSLGRHRLLFDFSQKDESRLVFLVYNRQNGRPIRVLQVPMAEYQALDKEIRDNPQLRVEIDHCFPGCRVDVDELVKQLFQEKK